MPHEAAGAALPPAVILVRPQMGENIGSSARAMMNCGLHDLRIVAPRDGWPNPAATPMAAGGLEIIEGARVFDTLADAAHDLDFLVALTARRRDLNLPSKSPRQVTNDLLAHGARAGLVFGPEASGLDNDEVARADVLVTADLNPEFPSLNLAHAVLMMSWEWRVAVACAKGVRVDSSGEGDDSGGGSAGSRKDVSPHHRPATTLERERFYERLEAELDAGGFFTERNMAPSVKRNIRVMFQRAELTSQDVSTLHGVIQALVSRRGGDDSG